MDGEQNTLVLVDALGGWGGEGIYLCKGLIGL